MVLLAVTSMPLRVSLILWISALLTPHLLASNITTALLLVQSLASVELQTPSSLVPATIPPSTVSIMVMFGHVKGGPTPQTTEESSASPEMATSSTDPTTATVSFGVVTTTMFAMVSSCLTSLTLTQQRQRSPTLLAAGDQLLLKSSV
jgi:hypothetical protein